MDDVTLSNIGMQRRREILQLAQRAAGRRRREQTFGRGLGVVGLFLVLGLTAWSLMRLQPPRVIREAPMAIVPSVSPALATTEGGVQFIQTDSTITDRLTIKSEPPRWTTVNDSELLQELADAGQPTGIVCMNGKTILLPRN